MKEKALWVGHQPSMSVEAHLFGPELFSRGGRGEDWCLQSEPGPQIPLLDQSAYKEHILLKGLMGST